MRETDLTNAYPIHWQGTDDRTPPGCRWVATTVVGVHTSYLIFQEEIIGRIEGVGSTIQGYLGHGLKGGRRVGQGSYYDLAEKILRKHLEDN